MKQIIATAFIWLALSVSAMAQSATIPSTFFGMNLGNVDNTVAANLPIGNYSNYRLWDAQSGSTIHACQWNVINTSNGVYNWTPCDQMVAATTALGYKLIITMGNIPTWVNSVQNLPTSGNKQSLYTYVSALISHYGCNSFAYFEDWNEFNYGATWWVGTDSDMAAMSKAMYAIVKTTCPNVIVLSASANGDAGEASGANSPYSGGYHWDAYLQACASFAPSKCFDYINIHSYGMPFSAPIPNSQTQVSAEETINWLPLAIAITSQDGFGSLPLWVDEGYIGPIPIVYSAATEYYASQQAVLEIITASLGANVFDWFYWTTDQTASFPTGAINGLNQTGQSLRSMQSWLTGKTFTSPVTRTVGTNSIRQQPDGTGAAVGYIKGNGTCTNPIGGTGAIPNDWSLSGAQSFNGINTYVQAIDSVNHTLDIRFCGADTTAGSGNNSAVITLDTVGAATTQGANWVLGSCFQVTGGSVNNFYEFELNQVEYQSDQVTTNGTSSLYGLYVVSNKVCPQFRQTVQYANTAYVRPTIQIAHWYNSSSPLPIDITIRISTVTLDQGFQWTGTLTGPNGYSAKIAWDASGGPSTISAPTGSVDFRDIFGGIFPTTGGTLIPLGYAPVLIENTAAAFGVP